MTATKTIAAAAGIAPRTRKFALTDEFGSRFDGGRTSHVLAALARSDKTPELDQRTRIVAMAVQKSLSTGRMTPALAVRMIADYTPYQVCGVVAKIAEKFEGDPTIGELADFWINAHAEEL
jgi:hypothetical protein